MTKNKIPSKIRIGGQDISVEEIEKFDDGVLGRCCLGAGWIRIANAFNGEKHSESCKENTYYHELTHVILDTMGESELSANEKFVSCFSSFLTEAMTNAYYEEK